MGPWRPQLFASLWRSKAKGHDLCHRKAHYQNWSRGSRTELTGKWGFLYLEEIKIYKKMGKITLECVPFGHTRGRDNFLADCLVKLTLSCRREPFRLVVRLHLFSFPGRKLGGGEQGGGGKGLLRQNISFLLENVISMKRHVWFFFTRKNIAEEKPMANQLWKKSCLCTLVSNNIQSWSRGDSLQKQTFSFIWGENLSYEYWQLSFIVL